MRDDLRKALRLVEPAARWRWYALVPLALLAAAAEAFGAAAVFGLLAIVLDPSRALTLPVAAWLAVRTDADPPSLVVTLNALLVAFYLARNALLAFIGHVQHRVVHDSITNVSRRLLLAYLTAPYPFHFLRHSASLIQRMTQSVDAACTLVLSSAVSLFTELVVALAIIGVLAAAAPVATLAAAAATGLVMAILLRLTGRLFERLGRDEQRHDESALHLLQQSLGAMKEVKTTGRERYFHDRYSASRAALSRVLSREAALHDAVRLGIETIFVCVLLFVVILLVWFGRSGPDVVALLGLYSYAGFRLVPAANRISRHLGQMRVGRPYLHDVAADFDMLETEPSVEPATPPSEDAQGFTSEIRFDGVSYTYGTGGPEVLQDVTLAIRKGEAIGIVGQTGAGKSTLVDLLLGLLAPTDGRVSVDGRDLRDHARWWQRQIGYVPQAFFIVDDTLRRNIAFAMADEDIDAGKVEAAVRVAQLEEFVAGLPDGLDTLVGERGIRLSGGERQRVAIARALYHQPRVLVFDEATAALDSQTERDLASAIEALHGSLTLIVIAHRLMTVRGCDRLVLLDLGRIAAVGTYDELIASHAGFRALAAGGA
jgi:ATP-binding cassette subfamily C protein